MLVFKQSFEFLFCKIFILYNAWTKSQNYCANSPNQFQVSELAKDKSFCMWQLRNPNMTPFYHPSPFKYTQSEIHYCPSSPPLPSLPPYSAQCIICINFLNNRWSLTCTHSTQAVCMRACVRVCVCVCVCACVPSRDATWSGIAQMVQ